MSHEGSHYNGNREGYAHQQGGATYAYKKNFIFIASIFYLFALSGCNQRPSPQEVAQLILDINIVII